MNMARLLFRLLLGRRLPITNGTLEVPGIRRPVLIRRDGYGIPYIEVEEDEDAWYGLGFCQGQDRAFQIETLLRVVRGTLAELVGPETLPIDRLSRRVGFRYAAEQQLKALDDETHRILKAFVSGVTAGARTGCRRPAHEFSLLRAKPTPYQAADVLGMAKLMSFTLPSNWDVELARLKILTEDGAEALAALDPTYPEWHPITAPPSALAGSAVDRLGEDLALLTATTGQGGGSNNWAIAPTRTTTGRAILANDPHLSPSLPSYWYLAHVCTPGWAVAGASIVGTPGFFVGHNDVAAWGMTAGFVDNTDLFIEEIGPDGRSVREGSHFVPCEVRSEVIQVKGGTTVKEEVLVTPRGPVISPALEGEGGAISLRATWLAPGPLEGLLQIHRAHTFEAFRRAFEQWPFLSLNMVYADTSGTIGWQLVGQAPRRRKGWGTIPLPGWSLEVGWEDDPVPFNEMPYLADPATGFIATANNQPTPEVASPSKKLAADLTIRCQTAGPSLHSGWQFGNPAGANCDLPSPFLGIDWIDGYRQARIVEALDARHDWDLPSVRALQMDQKSIPWRELRDIVLGIPAETGEARQALTLLEAWDGLVTADSPAAAIFEFFVAEMVQRVVAAKAPRAAQWALGAGFTAIAPFSIFAVRRIGHLVRLLREQPAGWFEWPWPQEMADALTKVVKSLRKHYGDEPDRWAWGRVRPLTLRHPVGERAPLDRVFNLGPFPWGGDTNTVGQAFAPPSDPTTNPLSIASLRMVVDVGKWEKSRFVLPGGQSGNPLSPHYGDLLPLWQRGEGVPIAWSPEEVARVARSTLHLVPG